MSLPAGVMDELELRFNSSVTIAPDDGRKRRPKHVELTRNNKLTCIVASCLLPSYLYHDAWIHGRQDWYCVRQFEVHFTLPKGSLISSNLLELLPICIAL